MFVFWPAACFLVLAACVVASPSVSAAMSRSACARDPARDRWASRSGSPPGGRRSAGPRSVRASRFPWGLPLVLLALVAYGDALRPCVARAARAWVAARCSSSPSCWRSRCRPSGRCGVRTRPARSSPNRAPPCDAPWRGGVEKWNAASTTDVARPADAALRATRCQDTRRCGDDALVGARTARLSVVAPRGAVSPRSKTDLLDDQRQRLLRLHAERVDRLHRQPVTCPRSVGVPIKTCRASCRELHALRKLAANRPNRRAQRRRSSRSSRGKRAPAFAGFSFSVVIASFGATTSVHVDCRDAPFAVGDAQPERVTARRGRRTRRPRRRRASARPGGSAPLASVQVNVPLPPRRGLRRVNGTPTSDLAAPFWNGDVNDERLAHGQRLRLGVG